MCLKRICVFCGSRDGLRPEYEAVASETGRALATNGLDLVYGGGRLGLMGKVADAALAAGGGVYGVIPRTLVQREQAHPGLTQLEIVDSLHERKARMHALADAFVALPGGLGTTEEFTEALTWVQLGLHQKPCGLVNALGYFDPYLAHLDTMAREGFVNTEFLSETLHVGVCISEIINDFASRSINVSHRVLQEGPLSRKRN